VRLGNSLLCDLEGAQELDPDGQTPLQLDARVLKELLARDTLRIDENTLFAVVAWAWNECRAQGKESTGENMRAALGDILYGTRFSLMDMSFLPNTVG